eukprot:CAMPEP_0167760348 /NCGR_PEP_ID=MMETSP0110_2-20121227/11539_1 /TAXON_ID=629695 /ORGANISM="Gymnochlora sp., Strain CCMP2014" /LENGTH=119 /DNA_ID=CAMNT_0007646855 /DNA_START=342 /DNA_END=701 /DNA_ORIENTATION=-
MISAKFFDDQYFNNAYYAKVGGVPCKEMNSLEVEFLFLTNFSLFVTYDTYKQYHTELRNHAIHSSCDFPELVPQTQVQNVEEVKDSKTIMQEEKTIKNESKAKDIVRMDTDSPRQAPYH